MIIRPGSRRGGPGRIGIGDPWWFNGLIFHAPFDNTALPLRTVRAGQASPLAFTNGGDNILPVNSLGALLGAGDELLITIANNIDWSVGTMVCSAQRDNVGTNTIFRADNAPVYFIFRYEGNTAEFYYGELTNHLTVASSDTSPHKVGISWNHLGAYGICIDGGTPSFGVHSGAAMSFVAAQTWVGTNAGEELDGRMKDLRIWNRAFSAGELKAITA